MAIQVFRGRLQQRFSTLAAITATNPILLEGEVWIEKDDTPQGRSTGRRKVGDGVVVGDTITGTAFNDLPFEPAGGGGGAPEPHAASHGSGGSDALTLAQSQVTGLTTALSDRPSIGLAAGLAIALG
jgi:hypothetical protein